MINHSPLKKALIAAGAPGLEDAFLYQDYLNRITNSGGNSPPVSEAQWEVICDMQGSNKPFYPSNVKQIIANMEADKK